MYTKIAHNKKEETLKAREMKKQEELKRKKKKKQEVQKQNKRAGRTNEASASVEKPAEGPPQEINENAQLTSIYKTQDLAGQLLL